MFWIHHRCFLGIFPKFSRKTLWRTILNNCFWTFQWGIQNSLKSLWSSVSAKIVIGFYPFTVLQESCILDVWLDSNSTSASILQRNSPRIKSVRIRNYSGRHFPTFGLNTERYSVSLRIQSECVKMQTRITPNTDTFYAVSPSSLNLSAFKDRWVLSWNCQKNQLVEN